MRLGERPVQISIVLKIIQNTMHGHPLVKSVPITVLALSASLITIQ